jgi:hypothetical protein
MSIDLDQRSNREPPMISFSTNTAASVRFTGAQSAAAANDLLAQRRAVLLGCFALLGLLAFGIAARSLDVRPPAECHSVPLRLMLGTETPATMTLDAGAVCAISLTAPDATIAELKIAAAPQHGTVTARGRTGAIYRPDPRYRGEDSFDLALRGRSGGEDGIAVVRVRVTVR